MEKERVKTPKSYLTLVYNQASLTREGKSVNYPTTEKFF